MRRYLLTALVSSVLIAATVVSASGATSHTSPEWSGLHSFPGLLLPPSVGPSEQLACPSAGSCVAVGRDAQGKVGIATQTSGRWGSVVPLAGLPKYSLMSSVSCWRPGNCIAVGSWASNPRVAMWTLETKGRWSVARRMRHTYGTLTDYSDPGTSVACVHGGYCVAGGMSRDASGAERAYLQVFTHGRWGPPFPVGPSIHSGGESWVTTISCARPGLCVAGGEVRYANPSSFVASEVNGSWSIDRPTLSDVSSSSCDAADTCVVGGWQYDESQLDGRSNLVAFTDGRWSAPVAIGPLSPYGSSIASCAPERSACTVMVTEGSDTTTRIYSATLRAHGRWSWQLLLSRSRSQGSFLSVTGLVCTSQLDCDAVGTSVSTQALLFLTRRDGRWRAAQYVEHQGISSFASALIACSPQGYCTTIASGSKPGSFARFFYADLAGAA